MTYNRIHDTQAHAFRKGIAIHGSNACVTSIHSSLHLPGYTYMVDDSLRKIAILYSIVIRTHETTSMHTTSMPRRCILTAQARCISRIFNVTRLKASEYRSRYND